jgi:fluoroquinolone transport system permease protein
VGPLANQLRHDLVLQTRSLLYPATIVSTSIIVLFILLLPLRPPSARLLAFLVFLDPATVGLAFVGAIVLVEKAQDTLSALSVTPLRGWTYVASKAATLTLVTFGSGLTVVLFGAPRRLDVARLLAALTLSSAVAVLMGIVCVAGSRSMNHLVMRLLWVTTLLYLPVVAHFDLARGMAAVALSLIPSRAMLLAIETALDPTAASSMAHVYALAYLCLWVVVLGARALRDFERAILNEGL